MADLGRDRARQRRRARRVSAAIARHQHDSGWPRASAEQRGDRGELARQHDAVARRPQRIDAVELHDREHDARSATSAASGYGIARVKRASGAASPRAQRSRRAAAARRSRTRRRRRAGTPTAASALAARRCWRARSAPAQARAEHSATSDKPRAAAARRARTLNRPANSATATAIAVQPIGGSKPGRPRPPLRRAPTAAGRAHRAPAARPTAASRAGPPRSAPISDARRATADCASRHPGRERTRRRCR